MILIDKLTFEERNAIEEFRDRIKDVTLTPKLEDPIVFYKFLKARDFNVDRAEKMFLKHITWRKRHQVDSILDHYKLKEVFVKYMEPSVVGKDKEGDLLVYQACGGICPLDILNCCTLSDLDKSFIWMAEKLLALTERQTKEAGKQANQVTIVYNLDGVPFTVMVRKETSKVWLRILDLMQNNYPEHMKCIHVINAPSYFVFLFAVIKSMMSNAMLQKIHVWGENGWKEELLKTFDANVLPAFLGGKRTDPDGNPLCLSFVFHGGKISSEYFLSDEDRYFKDLSEVKCEVVSPSEKTKIYIDVPEKGSLIEWEFFVKSNDIGFGLSLQTNCEEESNMEEEIIPVDRYCTADGNEKGFYRSQEAGKYIIIFDNSHSWLTSKEVLYQVTLKTLE